MEQIHHRASIAGYVTDAKTQQAISGVEITLEGQALRPHDTKKVKTRDDGFFYFLDLPDGQYDLSFLVPKESRLYYGGSDEENPTARVARVQVKSGNGRPSFDQNATQKLFPTRLAGQVVRQDSNTPISQAIVKLLGSEIQTLTDLEGTYSLSAGLQAGNPTVKISAKGFMEKVMLVTLIAGQETKLGKVGLVPS